MLAGRGSVHHMRAVGSVQGDAGHHLVQGAVEAVISGGIGRAVGGSRHSAVGRIGGPVFAHVVVSKHYMPGHLCQPCK